MNDDRLDQRLRADATGDRRPARGQFEDRMAASLVRGRAVSRTQVGWLPAAVAAILLLVAFTVTLIQPAAPPSGAPTPAPTSTQLRFASITATSLEAIVGTWALEHPGVSGAITVLTPSGDRVSAGFGSAAARSVPANVVVRIGESGRLLVAASAVLLADCARQQQAACVLPTVAGSFGLDDHLSRWYPAAGATDRTVRQLLEGTSGLGAIGPGIPDLAARVTAGAGDVRHRAALVDAILAAPTRFAAGSRREPVDSEMLLLEALIGRSRGEDPARWIDAAFVQHLGLSSTSIGDTPARPITAGHVSATMSLPDLDPALRLILGIAEGSASNSDDLASLAAGAWGSALVLPVPALRELTDATDGSTAPWAAEPFCPCSASSAAGIGLTGHAIAWSSLVAYDFRVQVALGIVATSDLDDAALQDLRDRVLAAAAG